MLRFWSDASPQARKALIAASLGWLLDAFDVMLYALVLALLMSDLSMDRATGGLLGSLTLAASAVGGVVFGLLADRWGRTRALSLSIIIYSVFTALCGVAQTVTQLAVFRGFGAITAEIYPTAIRATAQGFTYKSGGWRARVRLSSSGRWRRRGGSGRHSR